MVQDFTAGHFLTIYVLAYENAECVRGLLTSLLPLTTAEVCIVISDNSDKTLEVRGATEELMPQFSGKLGYWSYGVNVGMGNVLRPFETVRSPYLWIVGACNFFRPGALQALLPALHEKRPDALLHAENNLWRRQLVTEERVYHTAVDLIGDHSHSIMCSVNSVIHNTEKMRPLLWVGYDTASSMVPHAAMVYEGLRTGKISVMYLPMAIIERPSRARKWSMRQYITNMHCMFVNEVPQADRERFYKKLEESDAWIFTEVERLKDPNEM